MKPIAFTPIAFVQNTRQAIEDDDWGEVFSTIVLAEHIPSYALDGVEAFSHFEIIFYFHQVKPEKAIAQARHPRNNKDWPKVGTFAQRNKNRPNCLGLTIVEFVKREGNSLIVKGLDAIDGTPILDIKPVMKEFLPKGSVQQPTWSKELMKNYWQKMTE